MTVINGLPGMLGKHVNARRVYVKTRMIWELTAKRPQDKACYAEVQNARLIVYMDVDGYYRGNFQTHIHLVEVRCKLKREIVEWINVWFLKLRSSTK